jgi:hypothetical protein
MLQEEIPCALVGNFAVGSHFAIQQSPYANRALVETLALQRNGVRPSQFSSVRAMRLADLGHRFIGEPANRSFQRTLLNRFGGFAATCPINFGWRARGGISAGGLTLGVLTLLSMVAEKTRLDAGILRAPVARLGLAALHDFRGSSRMLREHLRDFTRDTLTSHEIRDAGIFDMRRVTECITDHFDRGADHYETIAFALDVALAHKIFCSGRSRSAGSAERLR